MAAGRIVIPGWMPALDQNGTPIPNVVAYFYQNNTTILGVVYTDETLTTPLPNPVVANSAGQFPPIWADDTVLFSVTMNAPFGPPGQPFTFDDLGASTSTNSGGGATKLDRDAGNAESDIAENIPITRPSTGAISRAIAAKVRETTLSVADFSNSPDSGQQFSFAQTAAGELGRAIFVPRSTYTLSYDLGGRNTWVLEGPTDLIGPGADVGLPGKVIQFAGVKNPGFTDAFADPMYVGKWEKSWVTAFTTLTGRVSPLSTGNFVTFAADGNTAVVGGTRSSDNVQAGYDEGGIGGFFFCDNDRTDVLKGMYALYSDSIRRDGAGTTHGYELDSINMGSVVPITPNNPFIEGLTSGLWVASGGGVTGANTASAAITILNNGARWDKGIMFHETALEDRGDGSGEAIAFGLKHFMAQYNASGTIINRIHFDGTDLAAGQQIRLDNGGFNILDIQTGANRFNVSNGGLTFGPSSANWFSYTQSTSLFRVGHPGSAVISASPTSIALTSSTSIGRIGTGAFSLFVNGIASAVNFLKVEGAATGGDVKMVADGSDTNISLALVPKGSTGRVKFGTFTSSSDTAVNGYIEIFDANGTLRRLATIA